MKSDPLLQVEKLEVGFLPSVTPVLRGLSWVVNSREILGVVGESGSGKTLACMAVMGLLRPTEVFVKARVFSLGQRDLLSLSPRAMRQVRGSQMSMVFQDSMTSLNPFFRVGTQISSILKMHRGLSQKDAWSEGIDLLDQVAIPDAKRVMNMFPNEISGGQRQRVMIAIAVACRPQLLIADEPTTALDVTVQLQVLRLLLELRDNLGMAIMLVSHDIGVVSSICDRVMVMSEGSIVECGGAEQVLTSPEHPYTQSLCRSRFYLESRQLGTYT